MSYAGTSTTAAPSSPIRTNAPHVTIDIPMATLNGSTRPAETTQQDAEDLRRSANNNPPASTSGPAAPSALATSALSTTDQDKQYIPKASDPVAPGVGGTGDITRYTELWNAYNQLADKEDKEIVKGYGSDLDTLLIFAGLFSATNTAFIIESYKDLKEDKAETTNKLLRSILLTLNQSSSFTESLLHDTGFTASRHSTLTNICFFTSLFCSLLAAFGAVIGKQWLNNYEKEGQLRSPAERGVERQKKYLGLEEWYFQAVIETLPTLLQVSLVSFLIGLVQFLWTFNLSISILSLIFTIITTAFWVIFIIIGASRPSSPFQTRLSLALQTEWPFRCLNQSSSGGDKSRDDDIRGHCVDWLRKRSTAPDTVAMVAKAITMLSETARKAINIDNVGAAIGYLVRSKYENHTVHLGVTSDMLGSSLVSLWDFARKWDIEKDLVHPEDPNNDVFLPTLRHELWGLLLKKDNTDLALKETGAQILGRLCTAGPKLPDTCTGDGALRMSFWENRCGAWFEPCKAELGRVWSVAQSILQRSTNSQDPNYGRPLGVLLESTIQNGVVSLHISDESLGVLMPILKDLLSNWRNDVDLVHQEDSSNQSLFRALSTKVSSMVVITSWERESGAIIQELLEKPGLIKDLEGLQPMIRALNGHPSANSITPMDRLRWFSPIYHKLISLKQAPKDHIKNHDDVRKLLLSTMWSSDDTPELEYGDVRVRWILEDFDAISPRIPHNYDKYLERWLQHTQAQDKNKLYIRSLGRLLVMDPEVWSTKLELDLPDTAVKDMLGRTTSNTDHLHCLTSFFLLKGVSKPVVSNNPYWKRIMYYDLISQNLRESLPDWWSLFKTMLKVIDSPTEGVLAASGFWCFLVTAQHDGCILPPLMRRERDSIASYLMDRLVTMHSPSNSSDGRSESPIDLHLQSLPGRYAEQRYSAINDIDRSCFILSLPKIHQDIQDLATEMFSLAISRLRSPDNSENFLRSIGASLRGPSNALIEVIEKGNYIETIAKLLGDANRSGTMEKGQDVRWWCLRLFLLMWHRRSALNPDPYVSDPCFEQLSNFFRSMKNGVEVNIVGSKRGIDEVPITNLSPFNFLDSACSYFEFVSTTREVSIDDAVVSGLREACRHVGLSEAVQLPEYQGDGGGDRWEKKVAPLVERIEGLRDRT